MAVAKRCLYKLELVEALAVLAKTLPAAAAFQNYIKINGFVCL